MKCLLLLVTLALFAATLGRAEGYSFSAKFTRQGAFQPTGEVTVENVNGDVEVATWEKNEILIEGEKSAKTEEELKLIELTIDVTDSRAAIKVRLPKRPGGFLSGGNTIRAAVRFKLTVPSTAVLSKISTVNSSVVIDGARGRVNASSVNGAVRATRLGGPTQLETVNGSVRASFDAIAAQQQLSFETVNGQIVVALPSDAGVQLKTSTVNGRVSTDFPIEVGGKISGKSLSGKIGDGRASMKATTVNGSIRIEKK